MQGLARWFPAVWKAWRRQCCMVQWHRLLEAMLKELDAVLDERAREVEARPHAGWSRAAANILAGLLQALARIPAARGGGPASDHWCSSKACMSASAVPGHGWLIMHPVTISSKHHRCHLRQAATCPLTTTPADPNTQQEGCTRSSEQSEPALSQSCVCRRGVRAAPAPAGTHSCPECKASARSGQH